MIDAQVAGWLRSHALSPIHVDCVTTVMLKILDGKCKMGETEKIVMACLYEQCRGLPGVLFEAAVHRLIAGARSESDEHIRNHLYEQRVLAETMLTRPVMKDFKQMIRQTGLFDGIREEEEELA